MTAGGRKWVLIAGILLLPALFFFIKKPQLAPPKKITTEAVTIHLKDGDIICRLGDRLWSRYFKDISPIDKRYSHLGIIRITDDKVTVIHAEGRAVEGKDFVNESGLDEFLEIAKAIGIYRLREYDGKIISSTAMEYIGYPFDWNFDLEEEDKIYCTKLLYVVLQKIAPEIQLKRIFLKELKKEIIPLEAVSNSEYFIEILHVGA